MPDVGKPVRAAGTLTRTTLYTVPASTKAYVKSINVANPTATSQAVNVWVGNYLLFPNINMPAYGGARDDDTHVLLAGELIEAECSDTALNIIIDIVEET